ncbi:hypothetical protein [Achromobacter denitrificans]|uniref:hypothetical protein n=1 Tax=Achromobacter denitrificans TaxID=32002 RepID=UPI000B495DB4|nr:hypothetical protein [Achromobacter denitrificans]
MQANPNLSTTPPLPGVVAVPALNDALQTIATDFSGDTDPAALAWPLSKWADTSTGLLKRRNAAGTEWVVEGTLFRRSLSIIPADQIPDADVGLIAVPSQGLMQWNGTRYSVTNGAHGQCRFVFVSSTECRLMPHNGDGVIIDDRQFRIPMNGVAITPTGLATNTLYRIYAYGIAGAISLEASTIAHSRHTNGIQIKTGDPTRTLVGMVYIPSTVRFLDENAGRCVASWFNRSPRPVAESATTSVGAGDTGLGAGVLLVCWAGEMVEASAQLSVNIANANSSIFGRITKNGTAWAPQSAATAYGPGASVAFTPAVKELQSSDIAMTLRGLAATNGGLSAVSSYLYASTNI